jgi:transcriptional regulator with XRE-family HTH domain
MEISWSDRIRELEAAGWSLTGLAGAIGLSPQGLSDIKHGRTKAPTGMAAVHLHKLHAERLAPPATEEQGDASIEAAA